MPKSVYRFTKSYIFTVALLFSTASMAKNDAEDYVAAYNSCKPVAAYSAREQCNYGRMFESLYLQCMVKYGYNDENSVEQPNYIQAYKYCSSVSDLATKENCNYGGLYNQLYSQCLKQYGFNGNGEKMANTEQPYFKFDF